MNQLMRSQVSLAHLSWVRYIIVVVVNDSGLLLIKLNPTLTAQLSQGVT